MPDWPEPGIHPDIPMKQYHAADLVSHSRLVPMLQSPQQCRYAMLQPPRETPEMVLGRALHARVLEPDSWRDQFAIGGPINEKTGKPYGRTSQKWQQWEAEQGGRSILTLDDIAVIEAWATALSDHPFAVELLGGKGRNELSLVWDDPDTGLRCRARVDRLSRDPGGWPSHIDLKTCGQLPTERWINRRIWDYGLDIQAAHYRAGAAVLRPGERKFWFLWIHKLPPYEIACTELSPGWEEIGAKRWRWALNRYAECLKTKQWPGSIPQYIVLEPPLWAEQEVEGL